MKNISVSPLFCKNGLILPNVGLIQLWITLKVSASLELDTYIYRTRDLRIQGTIAIARQFSADSKAELNVNDAIIGSRIFTGRCFLSWK